MTSYKIKAQRRKKNQENANVLDGPKDPKTTTKQWVSGKQVNVDFTPLNKDMHHMVEVFSSACAAL